MKKTLITAGIIVAVLLAGFFVPLGSYTTASGCPTEVTPEVRLHMIMGDSLEKIKANDVPSTNPTVGCAIDTKYTLYLL